ncbi:MAG: 2-isopropylmalate synthase [Candidatus Dadabacteria bacterium]|nr:MAG: 2-isopropylmalate synthase [Candidatus Dadabacteria bacterium]
MQTGERIYIFDTTLRDGQQCPGAGMSADKNIEYAELACKLGVDVLEAGFPSASKTDFRIVKSIVERLAEYRSAPTVAALCQLREEQIIKTIEALEPGIKSGRVRLHTYVPVDPALMQASLGARAENKANIIAELERCVSMAVSSGVEVQFSPEGYSRMGENFDFVTDLIRTAVSAGATVINCPDTIGGACELEGKDYFVNQMNRHAEIIRNEFPEVELTWSVHCHNDFGLAVQNTINAVFKGPARQIEGCINGVGERAGNASLEQCIMIIKHFAACVDPENPYYTCVDTEKLQAISDFVSRHMLTRQPHWPITGDNAARHSSGGHTNAILRNPLAYQAFDPRETGKQITMLFGPLSGGNHAKAIIESYGYRCDDSEKAEIAQFIKDMYADRRKGITDEELIRGYFAYRRSVEIDKFSYSRKNGTASVRCQGRIFNEEGEFRAETKEGNSALAALKSLLDKKVSGLSIESHSSESVGKSVSAKSLSRIVIRDRNSNATCVGLGEDQDIEISAMKALVDAVNLACIERYYRMR